jgi:phage regulator Rha-like protein
MSSLVIAEITGKPHCNVLRDIRNTLRAHRLDPEKFADTYTTRGNHAEKCYELPRDETWRVVEKYTHKHSGDVMARWDAMEAEWGDSIGIDRANIVPGDAPSVPAPEAQPEPGLAKIIREYAEKLQAESSDADLAPDVPTELVKTMSSMEIAEVTGKRHDNVMADVQPSCRSRHRLSNWKPRSRRWVATATKAEALWQKRRKGRLPVPKRKANLEDTGAYDANVLSKTPEGFGFAFCV